MPAQRSEGGGDIHSYTFQATYPAPDHGENNNCSWFIHHLLLSIQLISLFGARTCLEVDKLVLGNKVFSSTLELFFLLLLRLG